MASIRLRSFAGMVPRLNKSLLTESQSQISANCLLSSGALSPWRDKKSVATLSSAQRVNSIYLFGNGTVNPRWLQWNQDVNVVRGPVAGDTTERTYFTGTDAPRVTNNTMVDEGGNHIYPEDSYILGVPPPAVAPTAALAGVGAGPTYSRAYVRTLVGEFGEEGAPSPASTILAWQSGNTVNLTAMGAVVTITSSGTTATVAWTGHGQSNGNKVLFGGANEKNYNGVYAVTVVDANTLTYTMPGTAASPATGTIGAHAVASTTTVGKRNVTKQRIYRIATSQTGAAYLFVAEINIGTVTYSDSIADSGLAEALPSTYWSEPPSGLSGLILLPNGVMAGFVGNVLYMTPAYVPYAWPAAYTQTFKDSIVAISNIGTTIVVLTTTIPHLVSAQDPSQAAVDSRENDPYPCLSKRSVVRTPSGILYACPDGLASVSASGVRLITGGVITKKEWDGYYPASIHAYLYSGRYVGFYSSGAVGGIESGAGFIFDPQNPGSTWTTIDEYAYAGFRDDDSGDLYLSYWNGTSNTVYQWNGDGSNKSYQWKSRLFLDGHPNCFQAASVHFSSITDAQQQAAYTTQRNAQIAANAAKLASPTTMRGPAGTMELGATDVPFAYVNFVTVLPATQTAGVTFKYYADGTLKYQKTVYDNKPFRMPGGYRARESEIELIGNTDVSEVRIASTMSELVAMS